MTPVSAKNPPPLVLTLGDPAGIGGEIALKAFAALRGDPGFVLIADYLHMQALSSRFAVPVAPVESLTMRVGDALPVLHHPLPAPVTPGRPSPGNAQATIDAIARAVALVRSGEAAALVTNPINKQALKEGAAFPYPGHTEYLAALTDTPRPVMMLAAPELRVVPVTIHIPLSDVPAALTPELLEETIRITHAALIRDFGLSAPRLALAGLNPHAGEGGHMGREEIEIILPVLKKLRAEGLCLAGPLPADTMFHAAARASCDAAIAMYHDQALIPLKTLNFSEGVNTTLGLPFIRTSPDHGTAFDIAGSGRADPSSLIAALRLAAQMATSRP